MKTVALATLFVAPAAANLELAAIAEGSWFTKALTLTNVGCESESIQEYSLKMWHSANVDPTYEYDLAGQGNLPSMLASGESITICNSQCDSKKLAEWNRDLKNGEITEAQRDAKAAKCSSTFREKCNAEGALTAFTHKINFNGDDRIELFKNNERLESFQQVDHADSTCFKKMSDKNGWKCTPMKNNHVEFPASKLPAKCPMSLAQFTETSVGFHIGMFSRDCNPKLCASWSCYEFCTCFDETPMVQMMFDSVQYSAALNNQCPSDGDTCDCSKF